MRDAIQYLRHLGFEVDNAVFQKNSRYFRNALVRANYNDVKSGVHETQEYLVLFFKNLLLGESNTLKNRNLHISNETKDSEKNGKSSEKTSDKILNLLREDPSLSAVSIASLLDRQPRSIEKQLAKLKEKGKLKRLGPAKGGQWIIEDSSDEA